MQKPQWGKKGENNDPPGDGANRRRELYRYASLSGQVAASVGLSLFLGIKADKWVHGPFPVFSWALPLLVIVLLIVKLVKESSGKK
jgi:hypothetical protein